MSRGSSFLKTEPGVERFVRAAASSVVRFIISFEPRAGLPGGVQ